MDWIINRLSEPSTWRGLTAIGTAFGITIAPDLQNAIIAVGLSVIGLINVIRKDKSHAIQINPPAPGNSRP